MPFRQVNGIGLDGTNVTATFGKIEVPIVSATYGDKLEPGTLSFMGAQQNDERTPGTYSVDEITIKVSTIIFRTRILTAMPQYGGGNILIPIVIGYEHPDIGTDSDLLDQCRITQWPQTTENSNTPLQVELKANSLQIFWSDQRKTINQLRGQPLPFSQAGGF